MNLFYLRFLRKLKAKKDVIIEIDKDTALRTVDIGKGKLRHYHQIDLFYKLGDKYSSNLYFIFHNEYIAIGLHYSTVHFKIKYSDIPMTDLAYGFAADKIINHILKYCKKYYNHGKKFKKIHDDFEKPIY